MHEMKGGLLQDVEWGTSRDEDELLVIYVLVNLIYQLQILLLLKPYNFAYARYRLYSYNRSLFIKEIIDNIIRDGRIFR
jgi:hypothetical protein